MESTNPVVSPVRKMIGNIEAEIDINAMSVSESLDDLIRDQQFLVDYLDKNYSNAKLKLQTLKGVKNLLEGKKVIVEDASVKSSEIPGTKIIASSKPPMFTEAVRNAITDHLKEIDIPVSKEYLWDYLVDLKLIDPDVYEYRGFAVGISKAQGVEFIYNKEFGDVGLAHHHTQVYRRDLSIKKAELHQQRIDGPVVRFTRWSRTPIEIDKQIVDAAR